MTFGIARIYDLQDSTPASQQRTKIELREQSHYFLARQARDNSHGTKRRIPVPETANSATFFIFSTIGMPEKLLDCFQELT
jgi:hypothetical protein